MSQEIDNPETMSFTTGNFTNQVTDFLKLDDELKNVAKGVKDLKTNKTSLEERIAQHMEENGIPETISTSGKIKVYTSKSSTPINKALIEEAAAELFGKESAEKLLSHIESKRDVVEKTRIRRVSPASKKAKTSQD
jgi:hypothetical protein